MGQRRGPLICSRPSSRIFGCLRVWAPLCFAAAPDAHFGIEPSRVIKGASVNKGEAGYTGGFKGNWRSAIRTEASLNRLTAMAFITKCLCRPVPKIADFGIWTATAKAPCFCSPGNDTPRSKRDPRSLSTELDRRDDRQLFQACYPFLACLTRAFISQTANSSSNALASLKSGVSKPSVNQL